MLKIMIIVLSLISFATADFIKLKTTNSLVKKRIDFINNKIESFKGLNDIKKLEEVNKLFNFFIKYSSDMAIYNKSNYIAVIEETVLTMKGDCDDYVMAKAQALEYLGIKEMKLLYSTENGVRHIKLLAKVKNGYFVLDNYNKKFRVLTNNELNKPDNQSYSGNIYLIAAKQKVEKLNKA